MNVRSLTLLAAVAGLLPGLERTVVAQADIKVTPIRIFESRSKTLDPEAKRKTGYTSLQITLRISGDSIKKMTRIGKGKFKAVDDTGKTLRSRTSFQLTGTKLYRIRRSGPNFQGKIPPRDRHEVSLSFEVPTRGAKAISSLTGTATLRIAETVNVDIPVKQLKGLKAKETIDDAALKKLGLTAAVNSISAGASFSGNFKVTGDKAESVVYCTLVDANGNDIRNYGGSSYWFSFGKSKYLSTSVSAPKVPADAKLRFIVEKEFKDVQLTLNQKDIALP